MNISTFLGFDSHRKRSDLKSFRTLPHETFLDLDEASALLASQSLYRSHLKVDSDGGPMNSTTTLFCFHSIFSLTFFFFCKRFDGVFLESLLWLEGQLLTSLFFFFFFFFFLGGVTHIYA